MKKVNFGYLLKVKDITESFLTENLWTRIRLGCGKVLVNIVCDIFTQIICFDQTLVTMHYKE